MRARSGHFVFRDAEGNREKPITVWYHRAAKYDRDAAILFVLHGVKRNGKKMCEHWVEYAEAVGTIVVAPEFGSHAYRGSRRYNLGNVITRGGRPVPREYWTFSAIEHLFDHVQLQTANRRPRYFVYGHSAGAQFLYRGVLFNALRRAERAVAANPGWYTLPTFVKPFPYGLEGTCCSQYTVRRAFGRHLLLLLGEQDTRADNRLRKTPGAEELGSNRLERGKRAYAFARRVAQRWETPLRWSMQTVPGVGHNGRRMAAVAAAYFRSLPSVLAG